MSIRRIIGPLLLFTVAGCSGAEGDAGRAPVHEVSGKVTLGGKPLTDAVVTFSPKGQYPAAVGRTDSSGTFTLTTYEPGDGAAAGDYVVLVVKEPRSSGDPAPAHGAHGGPASSGNPAAAHAQARKNAPQSEVPAKYGLTDQSGLAATVTDDGDNTFNFDLQP